MRVCIYIYIYMDASIEQNMTMTYISYMYITI